MWKTAPTSGAGDKMNQSNEYKPGKGQAAFAFTLLFLLYFFDYADRMVVNSLFPFLQKDWGLNDAQCGLLVSVVYGSITIATLPISILVDRWSRKKVIGTMAVLWSLATAVCGFAVSFPQLLAARIGIGVGEAGYAPGGTAMISGIFSEKRRSIMMGIWNASIPLGAAAGIGIGGYVAQNYGWRHAFGIVALPGLIVSLMFFFVKDYKTVELRSSTGAKHMPIPEIAKRFLATPSLYLTFFGFAANTFVTTALITWLPTFFHRIEGIPMDKAGPKGGAVMLLAIIGAPLGGFLTDLWARKKKNARPVFAGLSALATGAVFFVAFTFLTGTAQYVMILLGGLLAVSYVPAAAAVTQDVVHPGLRAIAYSLCVVVQNLLGSMLGPVFIGAVSDRTDIAKALALLPIFSVISGLLFLLASRFYNADLDRQERVSLAAE